MLSDRVLECWVFPTFGKKKGVKAIGHAIEAVNRSLEHLHRRFLPFELKQIIVGYFLTRSWLLCSQVGDGSSSELFPASLIGSKRVHDCGDRSCHRSLDHTNNGHPRCVSATRFSRGTQRDEEAMEHGLNKAGERSEERFSKTRRARCR